MTDLEPLEDLLGQDIPDHMVEIPLHCVFPDNHTDGDRNKSATFNVDKGTYYCHGCGRGYGINSLTEALGRPLGLARRVLMGLSLGGAVGPQGGIGRSDKNAVEREPLPTADKITEWNRDLLGHKVRMAWLENERGWKRHIVVFLKLGYDGGRITFPIDDDQGNLVNVKRYKPGGRPKSLNWKGWGSPVRLWPLLSLEAATQTGRNIYIVEGEPDVPLLLSQSPIKHAITATGGAGKWPEWESRKFADLDVVIIADADKQGMEHAELVRDCLKFYAKSIEIRRPE